MTSEARSKEIAIQNCHIFFDYTEWIGRLPKMNSDNRFEKRLSFWLIHMKQAKKGGHCRWHEELLEIAKQRGFPEVFDEDGRQRKDFFQKDEQIGPYKVQYKESSAHDYSQEVWFCRNANGNSVRVSSFVLSRIKNDPAYLTTVSRFKKFLGRKLGPWMLFGFLEQKEEKETVWMCSRENDGCSEVVRVTLPSYSILERFFKKQANEEVGPVIDKTLGCGVEDMTGKRCGRWTCIGYSHQAKNKECAWHCVCDCGEFSAVVGAKLRNGKSMSCGCLRKEIIAKHHANGREKAPEINRDTPPQSEAAQVAEQILPANTPSST